jgi:hypothetical protein
LVSVFALSNFGNRTGYQVVIQKNKMLLMRGNMKIRFSLEILYNNSTESMFFQFLKGFSLVSLDNEKWFQLEYMFKMKTKKSL